MTSVRPFLMFQGDAEPAMELYVSLFPDARIEEVTRYGPGEQGKEGSIKTAVFSLAGQSVMGSYGFSRKFAWLADRFGVSWQLNLA